MNVNETANIRLAAPASTTNARWPPPLALDKVKETARQQAIAV